MSVIKLACEKQLLVVESGPKIYSGDVNTDEVEFTFCSAWDKYKKTAVFFVDKNVVYHRELDVNNKAVIPWEVMVSPGMFYIGVFGVFGDKTFTSAVVPYRIGQGAITNNGFAPEDIPTDAPTIIKNIVDDYLMTDMRDIFPETLLIHATGVGYWHPMLGIYEFDLPNNLIEDTEYIVTLNGVQRVVTSKKIVCNAEDYGTETDFICVQLHAPGIFTIDYYLNGKPEEMERNCSLWYDGCEGEENADSLPAWNPATLRIYRKAKTLRRGFLDVPAILSSLPVVEMGMTFEDGTTATFKVYSEVVAE